MHALLVLAAIFTRTPTAGTVPERPERPRAEEPVEAAAPAWDGDAALDLAGLVSGLNEAKVRELEQLIAETPDDEVQEKALLWFQLAEVHAEQHRYWRLKAVETGKAADAKKAKDELVAAVTSYLEITGNEAYVDFAQMDRVLFLLGFMADAGRYQKESRAAYRRLVKEFPDSPYVAYAHFAFGDRAYAKEDLKEAAVEYKAVLELPASSVTPYARYKLGWVALNLERPDDALSYFYDVAEETRGKNKELHRAAAKDLVRAYASVGRADKAYKYFQKVDKKLAFGMHERLADLWAEQGKNEKAIAVYRELVNLKPKHEHVCWWLYGVARLTVGKAAQVGEIERLVARCQDDDAAALADDLARAYHAEWVKTKQEETLGLAERLYRAYLDSFPKAADHGEMAYYHANLAWAKADADGKTSSWEASAESFTDVVHGKEIEGAMLADAAEAAVMAWINADATDAKAKVTRPSIDDDATAKPDPKPLPDREQRLLAAIADYRALGKTASEDMLVEMTFVEAKVYRRFDHLEEALVPLQEIVEHHRGHARGPIAIDLFLDALNRLGREDELVAWVAKLVEDKTLDGDLRERLVKLDRQAKRKKLEDCAEDELVACGQGYVELWNSDPDAADGDQLLWNAALYFERARSIGSAIGIFEELVRQYPKSDLAARSLVKLGDNYARVAWYRESAEKLEQYAKTYGGEKDAYGALSDAVVYRKGIGDDKQAIADTTYFVDAFADRAPDAAADAFFSLAAIYEKQGDADEVVAHLQKYLRKFRKKGGLEREVGAYVRIAELLWAQACDVKTVDGSCIKVKRARTGAQCGDEDALRISVVARDAKLVKQARKASKQAIAAFEKGGKPLAARPLYARALFLLGEIAYEEYLAVKFPSNLSFASASRAKKSLARFDGWLKEKRAAGAKASKAYGAVIATKVADQWIASAARLGQIEQTFAAALYSAPIPESVRESGQEGTDAYCEQLENAAGPHEDEAVVSFEACLTASTKVAWSGSWSRICERELGELRPTEYPTAVELRAAPDAAIALTAVEPVAKLP